MNKKFFLLLANFAITAPTIYSVSSFSSFKVSTITNNINETKIFDLKNLSPNQTSFQRAVEKLKFYHGFTADEHHFDLEGMSDYQTWGEALGKLRQHFANDPDFEGVKWEIVLPNSLIKHEPVWTGEGKTYSGVRIWKDSGEDSGHFNVRFKNIIRAKANMKNAIKKLKFYDGSDDEHHFDLEAMGDNQLWEDALNKLSKHFVDDSDFAGVQWEIVGAKTQLNSTLDWIGKNKTFRGVRIWTENEDSGFLTLQFKNIFRKTHFDYAVEKLKFYHGFTADEHHFDLEGMRGDQTWGEALDKLRQHFANDPDFEGVKWEIFGTEMKINSALHWRGEGKTYNWVRIWKDSGEDSGHFSVRFKNIIRTKTGLENAIKKLNFYNGSDDEHHFDLEGMRGDQLWKEAFNKLKKYFANDHDFEEIEWSIDKPEMTLKSSQYWHNGKTYQTLWIGKNGVILNSCIIYFKNVNF